MVYLIDIMDETHRWQWFSLADTTGPGWFWKRIAKGRVLPHPMKDRWQNSSLIGSSISKYIIIQKK
jgi:hypothetical protein